MKIEYRVDKDIRASGWFLIIGDRSIKIDIEDVLAIQAHMEEIRSQAYNEGVAETKVAFDIIINYVKNTYGAKNG